jgi:hypothetical protein
MPVYMFMLKMSIRILKFLYLSLLLKFKLEARKGNRSQMLKVFELKFLVF